jgi:hypothetical protein
MMLECYTHKTARAKKKHSCSLCEGEIEKGEEYIIFKGKSSECGWFYEKYHPICQIGDCDNIGGPLTCPKIRKEFCNAEA